MHAALLALVLVAACGDDRPCTAGNGPPAEPVILCDPVPVGAAPGCPAFDTVHHVPVVLPFGCVVEQPECSTFGGPLTSTCIPRQCNCSVCTMPTDPAAAWAWCTPL